jgi:tetratricopeptide (TPR) repeat protein
MKVRSVAFVFVSSVYLAAFGANFGSATASTNPVTAQAYQALSSGDSAKAVSLYSFAIESRTLEPELLANALLNRALAFQQQGQQAKAVDDYSAALSLDAMSGELRATALYNRGLSQQKLGKGALAIEDYTSALMLNPSFSHAFLSRANALRDSGQYLFALSDYERALKYGHPEPARVYFGEALTYELLKRPGDMKQMLQSSLAADASYQPAQDKMAQLGNDKTSDANLASTDETNGDPILTASTTAVGGSSVLHKPDLPKGIEPPASLTDAPAEVADAGESIEPSATTTTKLYTDRVPQSVEDVAAAGPETPVADKTVVIAQVPEIPKAKTAKPAAVRAAIKALDEKSADTMATASVGPVEVPAAKAASPVAVGWGVQIASAASEESAWTTWKNMQKRFKALADKKPIVVKADLGAKGVFYRVRLAGFEDQAGAKSECSSLKAKGVACFISKSEG